MTLPRQQDGFRPARSVDAGCTLPVLVHLALALYDVLWSLVIAGWLVWRLCRRPAGWATVAERAGWLPTRPTRAAVSVWIHAVSVGELLSVRPVLRLLKHRHPDWWIVLSTSQRHADALARSQPGGADAVCLVPWDFRPCVETALSRARPDLLVLVECELWPNLIVRAARRGARVLVINARIYDRDVARYQRGRRLFGPVLQHVSFVGAQSEADGNRFLSLGVPAARLTVTGSSKCDVTLPDDASTRLAELRAALPLRSGLLWVLASTHPGEEALVLDRCRRHRRSLPALQLLIAPRDVARAAEIRVLAERHGFRVRLRSQCGCRQDVGTPAGPDVILLDTVGELAVALGLADLVFVGGSLVNRGGQNPIEAGLHAKAVIVGPYVSNFAAIVRALAEAGGLVQVRDADELLAQVVRLLTDRPCRDAIGRRAAAAIRHHAGSAVSYVREMERLSGA
jgi:3-deoxy-D-manno-octulosonic-acid transferase